MLTRSTNISTNQCNNLGNNYKLFQFFYFIRRDLTNIYKFYVSQSNSLIITMTYWTWLTKQDLLNMTYWTWLTALLTYWITGHLISRRKCYSPSLPLPSSGYSTLIHSTSDVQWIYNAGQKTTPTYFDWQLGRWWPVQGISFSLFFDINWVGPEIYHPLWLKSIVHTKYLIDVSNIVFTYQICMYVHN